MKNYFLERYKGKTDEELNHIISNDSTFVKEARLAAIEILNFRNENPASADEIINTNNAIADPILIEANNYVKGLKKNHSFGWSPNYKEEVNTKLNTIQFHAISVLTFEKLGWDIVFIEDARIVAKRKNEWNHYTERIAASFKNGKIEVISKSVNDANWDLGRNSIRVKHFIFVFNKIEASFDKNSLGELELETKRLINWDDYEEPLILPTPFVVRKPNLLVPLCFGLLASTIIGYLLALLTINGLYVVGLVELVVAFAIARVLTLSITINNFTNLNQLNFILIVSVLLVYTVNQFFQFRLVSSNTQLGLLEFLDFTKSKIDSGLVVASFQTGYIFIVVSWIVQLVVTYIFGHIQLESSLINYKLNRVPKEVINFVTYSLKRGKSEKQIRNELSQKGWTDHQNQNAVFEYFNTTQDINEYNRNE